MEVFKVRPAPGLHFFFDGIYPAVPQTCRRLYVYSGLISYLTESTRKTHWRPFLLFFTLFLANCAVCTLNGRVLLVGHRRFFGLLSHLWFAGLQLISPIIWPAK